MRTALKLGFALFLVGGITACGTATASVTEIPNPILDAPLTSARDEQTAVLAGGCFWGVEAVFEHVKGVIKVTSGYSGGSAGTAQYETVSTGETGHAESVKIIYDPSQIKSILPRAPRSARLERLLA